MASLLPVFSDSSRASPRLVKLFICFCFGILSSFALPRLTHSINHRHLDDFRYPDGPSRSARHGSAVAGQQPQEHPRHCRQQVRGSQTHQAQHQPPRCLPRRPPRLSDSARITDEEEEKIHSLATAMDARKRWFSFFRPLPLSVTLMRMLLVCWCLVLMMG